VVGAVKVFADHPLPTFVVAVPARTTDVADGTPTDVNVPRAKHGAATGKSVAIFADDHRTLEAAAAASSTLVPEATTCLEPVRFVKFPATAGLTSSRYLLSIFADDHRTL